jgi:hypothetical protein
MNREFGSMAIADENDRRQAIATAIAAELERQALAGHVRVDVQSLASAVDEALDPSPPTGEGKRPEELNATNDG